MSAFNSRTLVHGCCSFIDNDDKITKHTSGTHGCCPFIDNDDTITKHTSGTQLDYIIGVPVPCCYYQQDVALPNPCPIYSEGLFGVILEGDNHLRSIAKLQ